MFFSGFHKHVHSNLKISCWQQSLWAKHQRELTCHKQLHTEVNPPCPQRLCLLRLRVMENSDKIIQEPRASSFNISILVAEPELNHAASGATYGRCILEVVNCCFRVEVPCACSHADVQNLKYYFHQTWRSKILESPLSTQSLNTIVCFCTLRVVLLPWPLRKVQAADIAASFCQGE